MLALGSENPPQVEEARTVQPEPFYRCSSRRSLAKHPREVRAPGEVLGPNIPSRMKERDESTTQGIRRFDAGMFVPVTALAREGQVGKIIRASEVERQDVLYGERVGRKRFLAATVLAAPRSTLSYRGPFSGREARRLTHRPWVGCPSSSSAPAKGPDEDSRAPLGIRSGGHWQARPGRSER